MENKITIQDLAASLIKLSEAFILYVTQKRKSDTLLLQKIKALEHAVEFLNKKIQE